MNFLTAAANRLCDPLFGALMRHGPWALLIVASLVSGLVVLAVYRLVSRPERVAAARNRLLARVLEIRLYEHDPHAVLTAPFRALAASLVYIRSSLLPFVVLLPILALLVGQLACWLEFRPFVRGEQAVVTARFKPDVDVMSAAAALVLPPVIGEDTPAVRVPAAQEMAWRMRAVADIVGSIALRSGSEEVEKSIAISDGSAKVSRRRVAAGDWSIWLYPAEPPLDAASRFAWIDVAYPAQELMLGSRSMHWLVAFIVLLFAWTLLLMKPMRVEL